MSAIQVITSLKRQLTTTVTDSQSGVITVPIWNQTVSNITVMAMGASAPVVLLSTTELWTNSYSAGDLGPSVIVGSAAFNTFITIATCVWCATTYRQDKITNEGDDHVVELEVSKHYKCEGDVDSQEVGPLDTINANATTTTTPKTRAYYRVEATKRLTGCSGRSIGTTSWRGQFIDAFRVSAHRDDRHREVQSDTCLDYTLHVLTIFWKILFAFVPPARLGQGCACFAVSLICIGIMTALVADLSSHLGCTIGLKDSVTAITVVALGTGIPDALTGRLIAKYDQFGADLSISSVMASNVVTVCLGIGIPWIIGPSRGL
ncbi:unnamed protein product [Oppiella nova]|uniref:Sodium/calcium exchanger membrane region domain-containing protein n=1 Tax=Oppiella nova TaxID=334625 RepID=A0A7R9MCD9_9ACAR|nr:unnamed protein product [Oppiella nova]CAG2173522.1 unnamed protein product [Oppiella nova]